MFGAAQPLTIKETARHSRGQLADAIVVRCGYQQSTF